jgi:hypothetical protein
MWNMNTKETAMAEFWHHLAWAYATVILTIAVLGLTGRI